MGRTNLQNTREFSANGRRTSCQLPPMTAIESFASVSSVLLYHLFRLTTLSAVVFQLPNKKFSSVLIHHHGSPRTRETCSTARRKESLVGSCVSTRHWITIGKAASQIYNIVAKRRRGIPTPIRTRKGRSVAQKAKTKFDQRTRRIGAKHGSQWSSSGTHGRKRARDY